MLLANTLVDITRKNNNKANEKTNVTIHMVTLWASPWQQNPRGASHRSLLRSLIIFTVKE